MPLNYLPIGSDARENERCAHELLDNRAYFVRYKTIEDRWEKIVSNRDLGEVERDFRNGLIGDLEVYRISELKKVSVRLHISSDPNSSITVQDTDEVVKL